MSDELQAEVERLRAELAECRAAEERRAAVTHSLRMESERLSAEVDLWKRLAESAAMAQATVVPKGRWLYSAEPEPGGASARSTRKLGGGFYRDARWDWRDTQAPAPRWEVRTWSGCVPAEWLPADRVTRAVVSTRAECDALLLEGGPWVNFA